MPPMKRTKVSRISQWDGKENDNDGNVIKGIIGQGSKV